MDLMQLPAWRCFWRLLAFQPWFYGLVVVTKLLYFTLLPQAAGLLTRQFFDSLTNQALLPWGVDGLVWLLIGIGLARGAAIVADVVGNRLCRHPMSSLLRKNLLAHLLKQPAAIALKVSSGEAVSRFRDDATAIANFIYMTTFVIGSLLFAAIALVVMVQINWWVTLLVFLPLVSVMIIANRVRKRMERLFHTSRATTGKITSFIGEVFGAVQAIQVATAEAPVLAHFAQLNEERRTAMLQSRLFNALINSVFQNITSLGAGLILLVAARLMHNPTGSASFSVGDFALFVFYLGYINELVHILGESFTEFRQARVGLTRLADLLQGAPPTTLVTHGPIYQFGPLPVVYPPLKQAADRLETVEVRGLTYHYPTSGRGIQNIDLCLTRGSLTVITGAVGAGKSTLLRVLLGLLPKTAGEIYWNGRLVRDPAEFFTPPRCAYTAQVPRLFSDTVRANLLLGLDPTPAELDAAIDTAVLAPDIAQWAQGLETLIGPRGVKLSGGQVQRVAAARMFVRGGAQGAELLVFDDLSSALDVETEQLLWARLFARPERPTCLVVSHRSALLQRADQVVVLPVHNR